MRRDIVEKLIKALRSGEYKQVVGHLRKDGCYCAGGVLIDILLKDGLIIGSWEGTKFKPIDHLEPLNYTPYDIDKMVFDEKRNQACLEGWNDREKMTFNQIADRLEALL